MNKTFEISIPTEWSEISIRTYANYINSMKDLEDHHEIAVQTISTLCNINAEVVEVMKLSDLQKIQKNLHKLISKPVNKKIINKIEIDGEIYGWHPKIDEMTLGEFVDLETYAKDNDIAKMMSVLYRPIIKEDGNRYDVDPYDSDVHSLNDVKFRNLSIDIGNAIAVFFWNFGTELQNNFLLSSNKVEKNQ
tara:strand:- start:681 stop:1253 length:573 start_codon:yes stop_codon:yes gene_type:complete